VIEVPVVKSGTATHIRTLPTSHVLWPVDYKQIPVFGEVSMTDAEYCLKLDELDQLLNDPDVPMQPDRIWSILADVSRRDLPAAGRTAAGEMCAGSA
jgi:hypothetical protein